MSRRSRKNNSRENAATESDAVEEGYPPLKWERRTAPSPTNADRARLGIAIALLVGWLIILSWLVWDSLAS